VRDDSIWFPASPNVMQLLTEMTVFGSQQVPTSCNYWLPVLILLVGSRFEI